MEQKMTLFIVALIIAPNIQCFKMKNIQYYLMLNCETITQTSFVIIRSSMTKSWNMFLILVGRYIGEYKPRLLAKLYLSYLQGEVQWLEFTQYAEIIDRFLPGDFEALKSAFSGKDYTYPSGSGPRLQSMGLVIAEPSRVGINLGSITVRSSGIKHSFTEFGEKLIEILTK